MSLYNYKLHCIRLYSAGVDYLTFLELEHMEQIPRNQDSSSTAIKIPTGMPFESSIQTTAFVSEISIQYYKIQ